MMSRPSRILAPVTARAIFALLMGLSCLPALSGCSHLRRDVEYSLIPIQPKAVATPGVRVELVDISRHGRDDYLIVRVRVHNESHLDAHFEPKQVILVAGGRIRAAVEEHRENDVRASDVEKLDVPSMDLNDDDDDDVSDWDPDTDDTGDDQGRSPSLPDLDEVEHLDELIEASDDMLEAGKAVVVHASGETLVGTVKVGKFVVESAVFLVQGSVLIARGVNDIIEVGIQNARQNIGAGTSSELAIKFEDLPAKSEHVATYLFFQDALTFEGGGVPNIPPLIVTNPQEPHMGFAPPQRARLAAGLRFGGGGLLASEEAVVASRFVGASGFLGPRVGPWSFTAVGSLGNGFMLGFDARRDLAATSTFLATLYVGYGRYWILEPEDQGGDIIDGRGVRLGLELMTAFSERAYDWSVVTGGFGLYLEAAALDLELGAGVHISGGLSLLAY